MWTLISKKEAFSFFKTYFHILMIGSFLAVYIPLCDVFLGEAHFRESILSEYVKLPAFIVSWRNVKMKRFRSLHPVFVFKFPCSVTYAYYFHHFIWVRISSHLRNPISCVKYVFHSASVVYYRLNGTNIWLFVTSSKSEGGSFTFLIVVPINHYSQRNNVLFQNVFTVPSYASPSVENNYHGKLEA